VEVVCEAPGVGANLQDHYVARVSQRVAGALSINELARGARLAGEAVLFALRGRGALTFGVTSAQVFCRSREGLASPDLQLLFTPASYDPSVFGALEREPGMTVAVCPVRPESRGTVMARSADPFEPPAIRPNYLASRSDRTVLATGIRLTRAIFAAPALARHAVREVVPGPSVETEDDLHDYARDFGTTLYHPVGTCRMGGDPASVVDARLRVRGVGGLRVVDASVMPTLTTGNTNAPTIMIAEKGAAMLREEATA
jgi:choline dehydrogenase